METLDQTETTEELLPALPKRRPLRPEWILGIIAAAAALLLCVVLILSRSYFPEKHTAPAEEDP